MFKVKGELFLLKLRTQGYTTKLHEYLERELKKATRAWLLAVMPKVPVWTGTAKGTLIPVARAVRRSGILKSKLKPIEFRAGFGPKVGEFKGHAELSARKFVYTFRYRNTLPYFFLNEFFHSNLNLTNPTPWFAIRAGRVAFINYVRNIVFKNTPSIKKFLKVKTLKIG